MQLFADFIKQLIGFEADYFDLIVNYQIVSKQTVIQDALRIWFQEHQTKFTDCYGNRIRRGKSKTETDESLKDDLEQTELRLRCGK